MDAASVSLQKEISRREAFERKNAELEGVNDELRVENGVSLYKLLSECCRVTVIVPRTVRYSVDMCNPVYLTHGH